MSMSNDDLDTQYINLIFDILIGGELKEDRTGTGIYSLFSPNTIKVDLRKQFPAITCKKLNHKAVFEELRWFLSGSTNINDLDSNIWNEWADENGSIGPMYGKQLRSLNKYINLEYGSDLKLNYSKVGEIDQIGYMINSLKNNPNSRRHVISTFNVGELDEMALWPCHGLVIQCWIENGQYLHMKTYQRSADVMLGLPFNLASYGALMTYFALNIGLKPGILYYDIGDAHIYKNHSEMFHKYMDDTDIKRNFYGNIDGTSRYNGDLVYEGDYKFRLDNYVSGRHLSFPVAV